MCSGVVSTSVFTTRWPPRWVLVYDVSDDGEGKLGCKALSATFGDSSPRGRAKGMYPTTYEKWSVSFPIRSIHCFTTTQQTVG